MDFMPTVLKMCYEDILKTTAVEVRKGCKGFQKNENVLNGSSLTVERGTVYGLLGASGCGKTTLLSCILSIQKLDSGSIRVFGQIPGSRRCGIPGPMAGFMPQESALYYLFSIYEALWYYGKLYGMENKDISDRIVFLKSFLDLPKLSRIIDTLSGGQTRRVSLALAMIHKPKLLILDEPSMGLDPVLRETIWNHLREIVTKEKVTVMVTTHYITEAVNFDKVGIMRNGKLIAEDSPKCLMELYAHLTKSLEGIVTLLCKIDEIENKSFENKKPEKNSTHIENSFRRKLSQEIEPWPAVVEPAPKFPSFKNIIVALGYKNLLMYRRDWMVLALFLSFIPLNIVVVEMVLGSIPKGLILAYVVRNESNNFGNYCDGFNQLPRCFSDDRFPICNMVQHLKSHGLRLTQFGSEIEALGSVESGTAIGYMAFDSEYAIHLKKRLLLRNFVDNETVLGAKIKVRLDMSAVINTAFLRANILKEYINTIKDIVRGCGENGDLVELPLKYKSLHGDLKEEMDYKIFFRPSMALLLLYLIGNFSGAIYVREKRIGVQTRGYVVGVKFFHQILSTLITDSLIFIYQISVLFSMQSLIFGAEFKGSMIICAAFAYFCYIYGMLFGIFASVFLKDEVQVFFILIFLNSCQVFTTGAFWPIECIPWPLRWMCYAFPITIPLDAFRGVMFYGWGITHPRILAGFASSAFWIFLISLAIIVMRKKVF